MRSHYTDLTLVLPLASSSLLPCAPNKWRRQAVYCFGCGREKEEGIEYGPGRPEAAEASSAQPRNFVFYSIQINDTSKGRPPSRNTWHGSSYFTVARKYRCRAVNFRTGQVASVLSKIYVQIMIALGPIILHASYSTWMCIDSSASSHRIIRQARAMCMDSSSSEWLPRSHAW